MKKITKILFLIIFTIMLVGCSTSTTNEIYNKVYDVNISISEFEDLMVAVGEKCDSGTIGVSTYGITGVETKPIATGSGFIYKGIVNLRDGSTKDIKELKDSDYVKSYTYYAITNYHVIEGGFAVKAYIGSNDIYYKCEVIATEKNKDLAILKFDASMYLLPLVLGNSDNVKKGQFAIAIGSPQGYEYFNSMTLGIVSYPNRLIVDEYGKNLFIQVDVAINPGNSGGPLLNIYGEVIGVNTMKLVEEDVDLMGFSIPVNVVKQFIEKNTK